MCVNSDYTSVTNRHLLLWSWLLHRSKEFLSATNICLTSIFVAVSMELQSQNRK